MPRPDFVHQATASLSVAPTVPGYGGAHRQKSVAELIERHVNEQEGPRILIFSLDPSRLAIRRLARPGPAVVRPILAILRLVGQRACQVSGAPDLIGVLVVASPNLNLQSSALELVLNLTDGQS